MNKVSPPVALPSPANTPFRTVCEDELQEEIEYEYTYDDYEQDVYCPPMNTLERKMRKYCSLCGMPCPPGEYHPYAACLMYLQCHDRNIVTANLIAVIEYGETFRKGSHPEGSNPSVSPPSQINMDKVFASSASPLPGDPTEAPCTACEDETDEAINPDRNFESSDDEEYEYDETDKEIDIAEGRHMECNDE